MHCDQCQMLSINGVPCHETGCPNSRKTWHNDRQDWVPYVPRLVCTSYLALGTACDCHMEEN